MDQSFTVGALRVLSLAERLARESGAASVEPLHVLWGLVLDESRAAEILAGQGITFEMLRAEAPLPAPRTEMDDPEATGDIDGATSSIARSESLRDVLYAARNLAGDAGRQAEIGTEYLLYGLAEVDTELTPLLRKYQLQPQALAPQAAALSGQVSEPIDVDFSIAWKDRTEDQHTDTLRILDAAANRAREGLRVVEDYVRFALDDAHLSSLAKHCRHDLTAALAPLASADLLAARDTPHDVGTNVRTHAETQRASPLDVLKANLKRAQEAGRTLEEFGKVVSAELGEAIGQLRYRLYTLEKAILLTEANRQRFEGLNLYLLVTEEQCPHGSGPVIRKALANGVGIIQVREKSMPDRSLLAHARRVREWTKEVGALCIINDRPDIAVLADADGVHVGQEELSVRDARRIVGPDRLVGVSTHTIAQARQAVLDGADYLGVGPVFPSGTKKFAEFAGLDFVREVAAEITLPWFAIGGITPENIGQVKAAGASRVAVSGAIATSDDPGEVAAQLDAALR
ncbi:MAG: thiamine phosphate synthase [Planctomycetaceae bacterium]|nr:thiamine phosphate synthase [Planctomycetaceae bacterium]